MRPSFYVPRWRPAGWRLCCFLRLILICVLRQLLTVWPIRLSHGWTYPREITEDGVRAGEGVLLHKGRLQQNQQMERIYWACQAFPIFRKSCKPPQSDCRTVSSGIVFPLVAGSTRTAISWVSDLVFPSGI